MEMLKNVILCSALLLSALPLYAEGENSEQQVYKAEDVVDHLSIASVLAFDGKFDKALHTLKSVKKDSSFYDASKFYTIHATIASRQERYEDAVGYYHQAISVTKKSKFVPPEDLTKPKYLFSIASDEPKQQQAERYAALQEKFEADKKLKIGQLYMQLSQLHYKNEAYLETIETLNSAGDAGRERPAHYALRADCYWKLENRENALEVLSEGASRFTEDATLLKQKFFYYNELKLYRSAVSSARTYMQRTKPSAKMYTLLAQVLMGAKEKQQAIEILEEAKALFPRDAKTKVLLAHLYLKENMNHIAANLFEEASYYDVNYTKEAAELHRRNKNLSHAIYLNARVTDKVEKLKQKVALYLDKGEFVKLIGLKDGLERYSILSDDNMRYALAYAYYMSRDYVNAEKHLKKIMDSELFSKATVIRKNIEQCVENSSGCI
jgi:predicted Zn-dependent protease